MTNRPLITVECDIPAGMTIREWRRLRSRPARRSTILGLPRRRRRIRPSGARLALA